MNAMVRFGIFKLAARVSIAGFAVACALAADAEVLQTKLARIRIDQRGFITSFVARQSRRECSPKGHPSPLLSLGIGHQIVAPTRAVFSRAGHRIVLSYPQGSSAVVRYASKDRYFRFQLVSLSNRSKVDNIVWGPIHTTVSKKIGDLIGVVRDDDWAIGLLGLDDNTIAGPPTDGDCYGMGYYVHSPDLKKIPIPAPYKEGQWFNIGGDGVSDVAFYSHPEEYFQQVMGNGAKIEPDFGSTLVYHSRDRRKSVVHTFSLLPGFQGSRPRKQVSDPVDVDYVGSSIALYACPDTDGLATIERIERAEGLPHPVIDGKWIHDPSGFKTDFAWWGPHDKMLEYAKALGLHAAQDEGQGEYYANPVDHWQGKRVGFKNGSSLSYKDFTDETNRIGVKYGLHTLCLFLQPGRCSDVTPIPNPHLQTVLRTKLAKPVSATDGEIEVTDPSYLGENGTWPMRDGSNVLRVGQELIGYTDISKSAPWILHGIKRGYAGTKAQAHSKGDELVKLQMNCYNGFCPDMRLMPAYADYYATVMAENGMQYIDFDGLESTLYQNHGYFAVRKFFRRLFQTYAKLTGGKAPRIMGSCVFAGGWEYMSVCNVGGGNNMFDPVLNRWGIEGKDIRNGFGNSYFPPTFGIQDYHSDWSVFDAENLEAKSIGWDGTYMLGLSEDAVEKSGEKAAIFRAIHTWEDARQAHVFTPEIKATFRDLGAKFHLEPVGPGKFRLSKIVEFRQTSNGKFDWVNPDGTQRIGITIQFAKPVSGCTVDLPGGRRLSVEHPLAKGDMVVCENGGAWIADSNRRRIFDLPATGKLPVENGRSHMEVRSTGESANANSFQAIVWTQGPLRVLMGS